MGASLRNTIECDKWRYITARTAWDRARAAGALVRDSLRSNFNDAAVDFAPVRTLRLIAARAACLSVWERARQANDFSIVAPVLQRLVDLTRTEAAVRAWRLGLSSPYEALMDAQTPGFRLAEFERWEKVLEPFCRHSRGRMLARTGNNDPLPRGKRAQGAVAAQLLDYIGVDRRRLQTAETPHALCLGTGDAVGLALHYNEDDAVATALDALHEGGHALYRQNILAGQGVAGAGMDEAMALLMENHIGRGVSCAHRMAKLLDGDAESILRRLRAPQEGVLRTTADEARYPLDIILRTRAERALFDGGLKVADLPAFWRAETMKLLGIDIGDDPASLLHDIQMFAGEFGRFPSYLFGQLAAAQIYEAGQGQDDLAAWLNSAIYSKGDTKPALTLVQDATGRALGVGAYMRHIQRRYTTNLT